MPKLDLIIPKVPLQAPQEYVPNDAPAVNRLSESVSEFGQMFQKAQDDADTAQLHRAKAEGDLAIKDAVKEDAAQYTDPDQFANSAMDRINAKQQEILDSVSPRNRARLGPALDLAKKSAFSDIKIELMKKRQDQAAGDSILTEQALLRTAREGGPAEQAYARDAFGRHMDELGVKNEARVKRLETFDKQLVEDDFYKRLEANPSQALKDLSKPDFGSVEPEKKRQWTVQANTAIRQGITDQERELKLEREKADLNLQKMIDAGATPSQIDAKLKEYTAIGVYDFDKRESIEQKLLRPKKETPQQVANSQRLLAEFNSDFPTPNRIKTFRDRMNGMQRIGDIGDEGAGKFGGHLNQVQQSLTREARAAASEDRRNNPDIGNDKAKEIIGENYKSEPLSGKGMSQPHMDDIKSYNDALSTEPGINKAELVRKIADNRAKVMKQRKDESARVDQLSPGERAAYNALHPQAKAKAK